VDAKPRGDRFARGALVSIAMLNTTAPVADTEWLSGVEKLIDARAVVLMPWTMMLPLCRLRSCIAFEKSFRKYLTINQ
jgi:hypothetical protein